MPQLPPLRTVRDARLPGAVTTPPPVQTNGPVLLAPPVKSAASVRGLSAAAAKLLGELESHGLLGPEAPAELVKKAGDRAGQLTSADLVLDALVHFGMLTGYQRTRVAGGNVFGLVFGNYRVLDRIGGGTIGVVFKAEHLVLRRQVAIKVMPETDGTNPEALARFRTECELLARVHHPNVIGVYDAGTVPSPGAGQPTLHYLVMELVTGKDLEHTVYDMGQLPVPLAAALARQTAAGLAAAHAHNLIHRDVKPSNILLTETRRAKLSDFGLARHFASTLTPRPGLLGSVEFMAPEQTIDAATAGPPADVYGLGATLFWSLTGQLPFEYEGRLSAAVERIRTEPPKKVSLFRKDVPEQLTRLIDRAMRKNPDERPTAWELATALEEFATPTTHPAVGMPDNVSATAAAGESFAVQHLEDVLRAVATSADRTAAAVLKCLAEVALARGETVHQQQRMQEYVRILIGPLKAHPNWVAFADPATVEDVVRSTPARNVGLVAFPEMVAGGGDPLEPTETPRYQLHTVAGCELLKAVAGEYGANLKFLRTAQAVIRSHHERWDGTGYPDKLARERIPHAARVVAVADAYDALRLPAGDEPGLSHLQVVNALTNELPGYFDPVVIDAFRTANLEFDAVFEECQPEPIDLEPAKKKR